MTLNISSVFTYDTDAGDYIQRVEGASGDNQALEPAVRQAINNFVVGCKQDGIWDAIKASCILAGARTLNGALQPLVGTAPDKYNFVAGDYNRKTGLKGDASTKYLNSNRRANDDPQNSFHMAIYKTTIGTNNALIGSITTPYELLDNEGSILRAFSRSNSTIPGTVSMAGVTGFMGHSRASSTAATMRGNSISITGSTTSAVPSTNFIHVFARSNNNTPQSFNNARLAFYSIGESLDLALLDGRVTDLINKFAEVIP